MEPELKSCPGLVHHKEKLDYFIEHTSSRFDKIESKLDVLLDDKSKRTGIYMALAAIGGFIGAAGSLILKALAGQQ